MLLKANSTVSTVAENIRYGIIVDSGHVTAINPTASIFRQSKTTLKEVSDNGKNERRAHL